VQMDEDDDARFVCAGAAPGDRLPRARDVVRRFFGGEGLADFDAAVREFDRAGGRPPAAVDESDRPTTRDECEKMRRRQRVAPAKCDRGCDARVLERRFFSDPLATACHSAGAFQVLTEELADGVAEEVAAVARREPRRGALRVMEACAGDGRLAGVLRHRLVRAGPGPGPGPGPGLEFDVTAVDDGSWRAPPRPWPPAVAVERADAVDATREKRPHVVVVSWMPPYVDLLGPILRAGGDDLALVVLVGPVDTGMCGDPLRTWTEPLPAPWTRRASAAATRGSVCRIDGPPGAWFHSRVVCVERRPPGARAFAATASGPRATMRA